MVCVAGSLLICMRQIEMPYRCNSDGTVTCSTVFEAIELSRMIKARRTNARFGTPSGVKIPHPNWGSSFLESLSVDQLKEVQVWLRGETAANHVPLGTRSARFYRVRGLILKANDQEAISDPLAKPDSGAAE